MHKKSMAEKNMNIVQGVGVVRGATTRVYTVICMCIVFVCFPLMTTLEISVLSNAFKGCPLRSIMAYEHPELLCFYIPKKSNNFFGEEDLILNASCVRYKQYKLTDTNVNYVHKSSLHIHIWVS